MSAENPKKNIQNIEHESVSVSGVPHRNEAGYDPESEKYRNLRQHDIWKRVDAEGKFVDALYIRSIFYLSEKMAVTSELGPDLKIPEDNLDALLTEKGNQWKLEELRRELATKKYVLVRSGTVSERAIVEDEIGKSPFVHLDKPGDKASYIRKKSWLEGGGSGTVIITVTRVEDGYRVFDPETNGKDGRFYSIPAIDKIALAEGWVSDDFPDTVPNSRENVPPPPKFFREPEKKEVKRIWKEEDLLAEIVPDDFFMLKNDNGGTILYQRRGNDFFDMESNSNDTKGIIRRLNNGWQLVEEPGSDFMAGRETRQFLSGETPEDEIQHTVTKKTDGYYIAVGDDWQGPLTKVDVLQHMRAEHWEPVVEINSLEDFLREGGQEAALKVKVFEEIFADEWHEFQKSLADMSQKSDPARMTELQDLWGKVMLPQIESMVVDDLVTHNGLLDEQAQRVVSDLSVKWGLLKK